MNLTYLQYLQDFKYYFYDNANLISNNDTRKQKYSI